MVLQSTRDYVDASRYAKRVLLVILAALILTRFKTVIINVFQSLVFLTHDEFNLAVIQPLASSYSIVGGGWREGF